MVGMTGRLLKRSELILLLVLILRLREGSVILDGLVIEAKARTDPKLLRSDFR